MDWVNNNVGPHTELHLRWHLRHGPRLFQAANWLKNRLLRPAGLRWNSSNEIINDGRWSKRRITKCYRWDQIKWEGHWHDCDDCRDAFWKTWWSFGKALRIIRWNTEFWKLVKSNIGGVWGSIGWNRRNEEHNAENGDD